MRAQIIGHVEAGGQGLSTPARKAVLLLAPVASARSAAR
jgi:hypothetical protein